MKKIFFLLFFAIFFIALTSAATNQTVAHGFTVDTNTASSGEAGMTFNVSRDNLVLTSVRKFAASGATNLKLRSSRYGANLTSCTFSGQECVFSSPYLLTKGTTYYLVDAPTGSINIAYSNVNQAYPSPSGKNGTFINAFSDTLVGWSSGLNRTLHFESFNVSDTSSLQYLNLILSSPANSTVISDVGINFTANYSTSGFNFTNATYYVWYSNGTLFNKTTYTVTGNLSNYTSRYIDSFTLNNYLWNVNLCGVNNSGYLCTFASENYSLSVGASVNSINFNNWVYETSNQRISAIYNILGNTKITRAKLIYNNYSYLISNITQNSTAAELSVNIDIPRNNNPFLNQSNNFSFLFTYEDGSLQNSDTYQQNSSFINLQLCNATYNTQGINYSIYDETNLTLQVANIQSAFKYWLGQGSTYKYYSSNSSGASTYNFCISPSNYTFSSNIGITLSQTNFTTRNNYFISETIKNNSGNRSLYLLSSSLASNVILEWKDAGFFPIIGDLMKIKRYYPSTNDYKVIHQDLTDNFGVVIGSLIENTVKYKFEFYNSNNSLLQTTNDLSIACRSSICIISFVKEDYTNDFDRFENMTDYEYSLIFNNDTNTFVYTWNDNTGSTPYHRIFVERLSLTGNTIVCNSSSTEIIGSLSCAVGNSTSSYRAQIYRHASPERRIDLLNIKVGAPKNFGIEGLIWSFFLTMTMVAVGVWNPVIGVTLYCASFIFLATIGLVYASPAIIIAQLAIGVAIIWSLRS